MLRTREGGPVGEKDECKDGEGAGQAQHPVAELSSRYHPLGWFFEKTRQRANLRGNLPAPPRLFPFPRRTPTGQTGRICINYGFRAHPPFEIPFAVSAFTVSLCCPARPSPLTRDSKQFPMRGTLRVHRTLCETIDTEELEISRKKWSLCGEFL